MNITSRQRFWFSYILLICLCGCPLGSWNDHYRPQGHLDTTLDVSPTDDVIVFNATGAGGRDLFLLRIKDLQVTRVAETPEYEVWPRFSPDGKNLVYAAGIPGDRADHLFVRPLDGGPAKQLTHADANDSSPKFSPNGEMIVFTRDKTYNWGGLAANWEDSGVICVIRSDGTNEHQLTADDAYASDPRFSADGKSIIFCNMDRRASIPVDGSQSPNRLGGPYGAELSPDSTLLAYAKGRFSPDAKIYIANADGTSERLLTPNLGDCDRPIFNRRGDRLFFFRTEWPNGATGVSTCSVWEATIDGKTTRMLIDGHLFDDPLAWTPNGTP